MFFLKTFSFKFGDTPPPPPKNRECMTGMFPIFLITAALNVLKPYILQVEKCKKLPKEKKTWVGIVGEMQNTWMKYSAL
jgi:hypothetical protein